MFHVKHRSIVLTFVSRETKDRLVDLSIVLRTPHKWQKPDPRETSLPGSAGFASPGDGGSRSESTAVRLEFVDRMHDVDSIRFLMTSDVRDTNGGRCHSARNSVFRRSTGHRVDKSLPGRHSRPADAERECRHLPTRPACRHFGRQMPNVRARRVTAGSVTMAVGCTIVSSTWAGGVTGDGKGRRTLRRPHFSTVRNMVSNASRIKSIFFF